MIELLFHTNRNTCTCLSYHSITSGNSRQVRTALRLSSILEGTGCISFVKGGGKKAFTAVLKSRSEYTQLNCTRCAELCFFGELITCNSVVPPYLITMAVILFKLEFSWVVVNELSLKSLREKKQHLQAEYERSVYDLHKNLLALVPCK